MPSSAETEIKLPSSPEAERLILGAILLDNHAYNEAAERLHSEDFSLDSHQRIFARMADLIGAGRAVDIVTLTEELGRRKEVESIGGVAYLASLIEGLPHRLAIADYVRIVHGKSLLRKIINVHSQAITSAADQAEEPEAILSAARSSIEALTTESLPSALELASDYLRVEFPTPEAMMERSAKLQGIPTGIDEFDSLTCGLQKSELVIVAARPSMGKSDWACNIIEHASINLMRTAALFSLEMDKPNVLTRILCARARIDRQGFRREQLTPEDRRYFRDAREELDQAPLYIDDCGDITVSQIRNECLHLKHRRGLDIVLIDYLQLLSAADIGKRYSREQDVANMSRRLKLLAKELEVPVILMAQISRENTKRTDKRPVLSDLRESGAIEQDADLVAFLHREEYYDRNDESLKGKAEIIIAKQRNGPVGTVHTQYNGAVGRWGDAAANPEPTSFDWGA